MNKNEYLAISSEVLQLQKLLKEIPEENVIERISLERRLKLAQDSIEGHTDYQLIHKAKLTFRGDPVVDESRGIYADFAAKATTFFADAIYAAAAGIRESFCYMGRIPDKNKNQLLITGTAVGSFGFEFEFPVTEDNDGDWFPDKPDSVIALEKVRNLLDSALNASDDDLADIVDEIHPRAVKKVAEFLEYISQQNAWCGIELNEKRFRFNGIDEVNNTRNRLREDNIKESEQTFIGQLQGVLPKSRTFEFKHQDQVIRGKVGADIEDAGVLNRDYLHKNAQVKFNVIQVGQGRPKYTLLHLEDIDSISL